MASWKQAEDSEKGLGTKRGVHQGYWFYVISYTGKAGSVILDVNRHKDLKYPHPNND
jgi:hypothetical protein